MSLSYRWHPSGTRGTEEPAKGMLWPFEHAVYRIVEVNVVAEVDWTDKERRSVAAYRPEFQHRRQPRMIVVRPAHITSGDVRDRDHDRHFRYSGVRQMDVYPDDHYPICASCREPLPCREQMAERVAAAAITQMGRYELADVCPACREPVTARQHSQTWPDNAMIPHGPPITFHLRRACRYSASAYERQWVAADPERRRTMLSCKGHVINHNDGTYQCSELTECPGPIAEHRGYSICRCPDCHAAGRFGCYPRRSSRNIAIPIPGISGSGGSSE